MVWYAIIAFLDVPQRTKRSTIFLSIDELTDNHSSHWFKCIARTWLRFHVVALIQSLRSEKYPTSRWHSYPFIIHRCNRCHCYSIIVTCDSVHDVFMGLRDQTHALCVVHSMCGEQAHSLVLDLSIYRFVEWAKQ